MIGLKPAAGPEGQRFNNTMHFKQTFLDAMNLMPLHSLINELLA